MKPLSKLNGVVHRWGCNLFWCALSVVLSVGLLYGRLAVIYEPFAAPTLPPSWAAEQNTAPSPRREDADLFARALAAGLLWLDRDGRIMVAPADLPLRQRYARRHPELVAPSVSLPDGWNHPWDENIRQLHQALHFSASGRYVRQQVEAFNSRQRTFAHIQQEEGGQLIWCDPPVRIQ